MKTEDFSKAKTLITSNYAVMFFMVIFIVSSVTLWISFFNKLYYNYFGFDSESAWDALLFACFTTFIIVTTFLSIMIFV